MNKKTYKIITLSTMMAWALLGVMQLLNPNPFNTFIDVMLIIFLIWSRYKAHEGWLEALDGWKESADARLEFAKRVLEVNK